MTRTFFNLVWQFAKDRTPKEKKKVAGKTAQQKLNIIGSQLSKNFSHPLRRENCLHNME